MKDMALAALAESIRLKTEAQSLVGRLVEAAETIAASFVRGGRLYIFGNGGSAADAQHLAAEFVNRYQIERPPLPAVALTTDTSILTSVANDFSFQEVFSKQIKALGKPGDVAWGLTTSGNSPNVVAALSTARSLGLKTIALTGAGGGEAKAQADVLLEVPGTATPRVQEVHITLGHVICQLVDYILFQRPGEEARP
ncbi:MAG: D-sedoheptulose 7-phosphate isomerase [Thermodesulfobacteriota bacterium]